MTLISLTLKACVGQEVKGQRSQEEICGFHLKAEDRGGVGGGDTCCALKADQLLSEPTRTQRVCESECVSIMPALSSHVCGFHGNTVSL